MWAAFFMAEGQIADPPRAAEQHPAAATEWTLDKVTLRSGEVCSGLIEREQNGTIASQWCAA